MNRRHERARRPRGVASAHLRIVRADGTVEWRRSVHRPVPVWSLRLWLVWLRKHIEYTRQERHD